MFASCWMSIAFWWVSALHDHNYRLPKLIISSRLMCWRLFVIFFVRVFFVCWFVVQLWSKSAVVVRTANARYDIIFKRSIKTQKVQSTKKMQRKRRWKMNECTHRFGKCMTLWIKRNALNASRTRKRSINSWINSRSQCAQYMLNNTSRERIMSKFHAIKQFLSVRKREYKFESKGGRASTFEQTEFFGCSSKFE